MQGFFCLWVPQFAAWVWEQSEKSLRGQAFAVSERGRIVAASRLAMGAGVRFGMSNGRAQSCFSGLRLVERDRNREELSWAEVESSKVSPLLRGWRVHGGFGSDRATAHAAALSVECGHTRSVSARSERTFAICLEHAISEGTFYRWKSKFAA